MAEMTCITAPNFTDPSSYQISQLPRPAITAPTDVVIKVHAASINPIDVKLASGAFQNAGLAERSRHLPIDFSHERGLTRPTAFR